PPCLDMRPAWRPARCQAMKPSLRRRQRSGVQLLAVSAVERAPLLFPQPGLEPQLAPAPGALGPGVHLVVLLEHEVLLPAVEVEAVLARLLHQFAQFAWGQGADGRLGMHADAEQHLV